MREGYARVAGRTVVASCRAKRIVLGTPLEGEEWALGPWPVLRHFRLLLASLTAVENGKLPPVGEVDLTVDGRLRIELFPHGTLDSMLLPGTQAHVHLQSGLGAPTLAARAGLYRGDRTDERIALVLGAGNAAAIPCMDLLTEMFNGGKVCLLKMHPLNSYLGPFYEEAFATAIEQGFLRIVYGGAEAGHYLCDHPEIDTIHLTGSAETREEILWGEPAGRARRKARAEAQECPGVLRVLQADHVGQERARRCPRQVCRGQALRFHWAASGAAATPSGEGSPTRSSSARAAS